jgi:hypothetical protein
MISNREYSALVEKGEYPEDPIVPIDPPFVNQNGSIINLLTERFTHVAMLNSPDGAVRANHYHKTDWHYSYVLRGTMHYYFRRAGSRQRPRMIEVRPGMMVFSPPLVEHGKFFVGSSQYMTFAKNERSDHAIHEADLVRVPLIKAEWSPAQGRWMDVLDPLAVDE